MLCYDWLEPPDSQYGVFKTHPQVKTWCRDHLWIPDDGRVNLVFDIESIDLYGHPETAKTICADVQEVSNELVKNDGRLLIIDNDCHGNNQLFGNLELDTDDDPEHTWTTKLSTEYRLDGQNVLSTQREPIRMDIPVSNTESELPWRRLM